MSERKINLDILRIISIFAVILLHISGYFIVNYDTKTAEFLTANIIDSLTRFCVPCLLMISGTLMLDDNKNYNYKYYFTKVKKIIFILLFWSLFYCIFNNILIPLYEGKAISTYNIVSSLVYGNFHLWYLYMLIGIYIVTPFLKKICNEKNEKMILSFILISLITQFTFPIISELFNILKKDNIDFITRFIDQFNLEFFNGYIAYYLTGYYITNFNIKKEKIIYLLSIFSITISILYVGITGNYSNAYLYINLFVYLYSIGVFLYFSRLNENITLKFEKKIKFLSKYCFGVYLIHPLIQTIFLKIISYNNIPTIIYIVLAFIVISFISYILCMLISKIPILQKCIKL